MPPTFQVVGDNVDMWQKASHATLALKEKDHHWFYMYAVTNHITGEHLRNDKPVADVKLLPLGTWLPSVEDCVCLRDEFIIHVSRVIVKHFQHSAS